MNDHDEPHQHAGVPFVGGAFPTLRASESVVSSDGGSFLLHFIERRPLARIGDVVSADHEVGRFALSPVVLMQLRDNIDDAIGKHTALFGVPPLAPENLPLDAMDAARRTILGGIAVLPGESDENEPA